jgi:hypothetical protein
MLVEQLVLLGPTGMALCADEFLLLIILILFDSVIESSLISSVPLG